MTSQNEHPSSKVVSDITKAFLGESPSAYSDVVLIASDGERVPSCRGLLACRNHVFAKLLFSDFKEGRETEVTIDIPGDILRAILHHLYTGAVELPDEGVVGDLLQTIRLWAGTHFLDCEEMCTACESHFLCIVSQNLSWVCTAIEAIFRDGPGKPAFSVISTLVDLVRKHPVQTFLIPGCLKNVPTHERSLETDCVSGADADGLGVVPMSAGALQFIFMADVHEPCVSDEFWFQVIVSWVRGGRTRDNGLDKEKSKEAEARKRAGRDMVREINAANMPLDFLLEVVEPAGLMTMEAVCDGMRHHALEWSRGAIQLSGLLGRANMQITHTRGEMVEKGAGWGNKVLVKKDSVFEMPQNVDNDVQQLINSRGVRGEFCCLRVHRMESWRKLKTKL